MAHYSGDDLADRAFDALFKLFSDERLNSRKHRRCPIDQPPTGFDEIWASMVEDIHGRNIEYDLWVDNLRQHGLISW